MFNNPYYNSQSNLDRINEQINHLEKLKQQMQQPVQPITQNFQLAPTNKEVMKYATSIEEVQKDIVMGDTPYFSKDMSVVWIKSANGDIKIYELNEIIPKDEKDLKIEYLQAEIEELKKGLMNNEPNADVDEPVTKSDKSEEPSSVSTSTKSSKKYK